MLSANSEETYTYHVGIDPGYKNLGLAICKKGAESGAISLMHSEVINVSTFPSITKFIDYLDNVLTPLILHVDTITIERYVAYANIDSAEMERINQVIGALIFYFGYNQTWNIEPLLVRAIDWKTNLVKALYKKKGFRNPSDKLDKKFSIAAAIASVDTNKFYKTDHEADAVCLATYPLHI